MAEASRKQAEVIKRIAAGDLGVAIEPRSPNDEVSIALRAALGSLQGLTDETTRLSQAAVEGQAGHARQRGRSSRAATATIVAGRQRHAGRGDRAAERGRRVRGPDLQGRHPAEDHRQLQRRLQRDQEQPEHVHRRGQRAGRPTRTCCRRRRWRASWRPAPTPRKHQGDFRKIVEGVNETLDAVIGPLNVAAEYVDRISQGRHPAEDHRQLQRRLQRDQEQPEHLHRRRERAGRRRRRCWRRRRWRASWRPAPTRAKHQGDFRKIVRGRQRDARRGDRAAERGGGVRGPDHQGRHPAEDHRQLQRRLQRDQEQPEHVHRRAERRWSPR